MHANIKSPCQVKLGMHSSFRSLRLASQIGRGQTLARLFKLLVRCEKRVNVERLRNVCDRLPYIVDELRLPPTKRLLGVAYDARCDACRLCDPDGRLERCKRCNSTPLFSISLFPQGHRHGNCPLSILSIRRELL